MPGLDATEGALTLNAIERETLQVRLYSTLVAAYGDYTTACLEVTRMRDAVLPRLARAEQAADHAWRAGAISYLEWAQLQRLRMVALHCQLQTAIQAQRALIELQRLTGQAIVAGVHATSQDTSPQ
ncbi:hypothetical protein FUT69_07925 [Xylella taiwanensis]|uniref:Uncharacterized protein n=1 Tax=Xylella taiwanensis TaxID=1444770 RepID=Z9JIY9_9GAMM|nr:hypothetical protein AF72_09000 [Xylella taiwanensis]NBI37089.1 hypothetical protein [Xylella taiwanensis]